MSVYLAAQLAVYALAFIFMGLAERNMYVARRLADVTQAQRQCEAAYHALAAAYRAHVDPSAAKEQVAAAETAVQRAESRLSRSKATRSYFAAKGTP